METLNFNATYLRDTLYQSIITDCLDNVIKGVDKRVFNNVNDMFHHTFKLLLAAEVFRMICKTELYNLKSRKVEAELYAKNMTETAAYMNLYRNSICQEVLAVSWLSIDSFRWDNSDLLPKQLNQLKNSLTYDLPYGLVLKAYRPITMYSMVLLNPSNYSDSFNNFLIGISDSVWDDLRDRTKIKIENRFCLNKEGLEMLNKACDNFSKFSYLKV
jgi:hypothetical protein